MNRTCEEYVLNELENVKVECREKDKAIEELSVKNSELRSKVVSLNVALKEKQKVIERLAELIELKAGTLNDEIDNTKKVSAYGTFTIWEDENKELYDLLKPYVVNIESEER
jgi:trehalose-6-phosphate synthase